jgi:hypothetical protein
MTAWSMDQKVKDIERAKFWKSQGYSFDPDYMTAWSMDQKVKDIERAKFWKSQGYLFDPDYMTAWSMDQKVKDIERAKFWKSQGYTFDPEYMTAWSMDQEVKDIEKKGYHKRSGMYYNKPSVLESYEYDNSKYGITSERSNKVINTQNDSYIPVSTPSQAENGDYYNIDNDGDGRVEPIHVNGYYRKDGTYVRGHYRAKAR